MVFFLGVVRPILSASMRLSALFNDHVRHSELSNGTTVVTQPHIADSKFRFSVLVKAGALQDPEGQEGLAHLLEHTLISDELRQDFRGRRGSIGALTSAKFVQINGEVENTPENVEFALSAIQKMLTQEPEEAEFEKEKNRLHNEINWILDQPERYAHIMLERAYKAGRSIVSVGGKIPDILGLKTRDALDFKKKWFTGDNIIMAFTGVSSHQKAVEQAEGIFSGIKPVEGHKKFEPQYQPSDVREINDSLRQLYFGISYTLPPMDDRQQRIAQMANAMIDEVLSDEITQKKGVVYHIDQDMNFGSDIEGYLKVQGNVLPKDGDKIMDDVADILARFSVSPDPAMFDIVKDSFLESVANSRTYLPVVPKNADRMAIEFFDRGQSQTLLATQKLFQSITLDDIRDFVSQTLEGDPSLIAYGDSSKLQSRQYFIDRVRERQEFYRASLETPKPPLPFWKQIFT